MESKAPQVPVALEKTPQLPGPPKPVRARRKQARPLPAAAAQQSTVATAETVGPSAPTAPPVVQLTPLLSDSEKQTYSAAVADLLGKAEKNLASAAARNPNEAQRQLMVQAKRFIAQCGEVKGKDWAAAKSLAERAEIISREVLAQVR